MKISTKQGKKYIEINPEHLKFLISRGSQKKRSAEDVLHEYLEKIISNRGVVPEAPLNVPMPPSKTSQVLLGGIALTEEQQIPVNLVVNEHKSVVINAYAGTGKTTLLYVMAKKMPHKKGLYVTFNRRNADHAKLKFPRNVTCCTAHTLALKAMGKKFADRLKRRLTGFDIARRMNLSPLPNMTKAITGEIVLATINAYCYSADTTIQSHHVPSDYLEFFETDIEKSFNREVISDYARDAWEILCNPEESLPIIHDLYLKLWALDNPTLRYDFIFLDEGQDSNPVLLDVFMKQNVQKVVTGDFFQSIYSWRGAVNAMGSITLDEKCYITQSFRYGQAIADTASTILNKAFEGDIRIKGCPEINSELTTNPCRTILCRTNLRLIDRAMKIYRQNHNVKIHIVGKSSSSGHQDELTGLLNGAQDLMNGNRTIVPELRSFASWQEVVNYSQTDAGKQIGSLVQMVTMWPIRSLLDTLQRIGMNSENNADVVLSTVHKAKGMEWPEVELENDFRVPGTANYTEEESHLLYVAITRASEKLNIFECEACDGLLSQWN